MDDAISVEHLRKSFGDFSLEDVSLSVPRGYVTGLIGENGAGKTALIKCMTGSVIPDSGDVSLNDVPGVVFDGGHFPEDLTVGQLGRILAGTFGSWDQTCYERMVSDAGVGMGKRLKSLSRGMGMKVQVAAAMSRNPDILILDEPTAGMDPAARDEFLDSIRGYIQDEDRTVLISSHITSDLEKVADRIAFMHRGRIVLSEDKDELLERFGVLRCGASDWERVDRSAVVKLRRGDMGVVALVDDKAGMREAYPELVVDDASLDDIMVLTIRGEDA